MTGTELRSLKEGDHIKFKRIPYNMCEQAEDWTKDDLLAVEYRDHKNPDKLFFKNVSNETVRNKVVCFGPYYLLNYAYVVPESGAEEYQRDKIMKNQGYVGKTPETQKEAHEITHKLHDFKVDDFPEQNVAKVMEKYNAIIPDYYNKGSIQCIDALIAAHGKQAVADFCLCNAHKYIWRTKEKNGIEDIDKAIWYLNKYKELVK